MKKDKEYFFIVTILGNSFSSTRFQEKSEFQFTEVINKGDEIYKKNKVIKIADQSYVSFFRKIKIQENWNIILNELLDYLALEYNLIKSLGGENIQIHFGIGYKNQCNFELSVNEIEKMNKIKCTFSLSAYQI